MVVMPGTISGLRRRCTPLRAVFAALLLLGLGAGPAMAVETPRYEVKLKDGPFEVRAYPPLLAAEVAVEGEREAAINRGFRLLADYIFGANRSRAKVAMTAPVTQTPSEKIAMTAPVTQTPQGKAWSVRFIMPAQYTRETIPEPLDPAVRIVEEPAWRVAALRFSGFSTADRLARKSAELEAAIRAKGLKAAGPITFAFYDPPWTPPFLRRSEVMAPVSGE